VDAEQKQIEKEKKQLLRVMRKNPTGFRTEWIRSLGWDYSDNYIDHAKITKRLKQLEADGLVIQIGHRYLVK